MSGTLQAIPSQGGPNRNGPVMTVSFSPPPPTPADFYAWPTLPNPLPDDFIEKINWHRSMLPSNYDFKKRSGGYFCLGKHHKTTEIAAPPESDNPQLVAVMEHLDMVELNGEGRAESVMTGDGAIFTWARGLAYHNGAFPDVFTEFLGRSEAARKSFLDHGVAMVDKQFRIVDTGTKNVLVHLEAARFLAGHEPADLKKRLLSIFIKVTGDFGVEAATTQWVVTRKKYVLADKAHILDMLAAGWTKEAICYVIHCNYWGTFAGYPTFKRTNGSLAQILRAEVENTRFYDVVELHDKSGSYRVVPHTLRGMNPSITMIANMGHGIMKSVLQSHKFKEEMEAAVRPGDIVFDMGPYTPPVKYYILRGTSAVQNEKDKFAAFAQSHHHLAMSQLLGKLKAMSYADLKKRRDWYGEKDNASRAQFGPRLLVAMDAVLHKNEGPTAQWVLDSARYAGISETSNWDQFELIKQTVGLA